MKPMGRHELGLAIIVGLGAAIIGVLASGFYVLVRHGFQHAVLVWGAAAALGVLLIPALRRRTLDIFEPLCFVILAVTVGVTLKVPFVYLSSHRKALDTVLLGKTPDALFSGMTLILLGLIFFVAGYMMRSGAFNLSSLRIIRRTELRPFRSVAVSSVILATSSLGIYFFIKELGVLALSPEALDLSAKRFLDIEGSQHATALGYLRWAISLAAILFCITLAHAFTITGRRRVLVSLIAAASLFITLGFAIFTSSRIEAALVFLVALLTGYYAGVKIRPARVLFLLALCAAVLAAITTLRATQTNTAFETTGFSDAFIEMTVGSRHFLDISKTSHIVNAVPEAVPFQYGKTLVNWVFAPVPRSIWPDKPPVGVGPIIGEPVFGPGNAGVPPGIIAELYLNFHVPGVMVGMFLIGLVLRVFYQSVLPELEARNPNAIALYAVLILTISFHFMEADFSKIVVAVLMDLLPFLAMAWLMCGYPPGRRAIARGNLQPQAA